MFAELPVPFYCKMNRVKPLTFPLKLIPAPRTVSSTPSCMPPGGFPSSHPIFRTALKTGWSWTFSVTCISARPPSKFEGSPWTDPLPNEWNASSLVACQVPDARTVPSLILWTKVPLPVATIDRMSNVPCPATATVSPFGAPIMSGQALGARLQRGSTPTRYWYVMRPLSEKAVDGRTARNSAESKRSKDLFVNIFSTNKYRDTRIGFKPFSPQSSRIHPCTAEAIPFGAEGLSLKRVFRDQLGMGRSAKKGVSKKGGELASEVSRAVSDIPVSGC